jgi:PBP1b-binding outer membrane lipoprotein LpoB
MRRLAAAMALLALLASGCMKEQTSPPPGDLDSIESTLNSVENELNEP